MSREFFDNETLYEEDIEFLKEYGVDHKNLEKLRSKKKKDLRKMRDERDGFSSNSKKNKKSFKNEKLFSK